MLMNSDTNFSSSALVYQAWHYPQGLLINAQAHPLLALYHSLGPSPNPSLKASLTIGSWTSRLPVRGFTPQNAPEVLSRAPIGILRPVRVQQSWLKTGRARLCRTGKGMARLEQTQNQTNHGQGTRALKGFKRKMDLR